MNTSTITKKIGEVSNSIDNCRIQMTKAREAIANTKSILDAIPTAYGEMITAINDPLYTGALATVHKDQLAKLVAEFNALSTAVGNVLASAPMNVVF